mmetsp:Transcript_54093/g.125820  ORF Transcript_54093/g.125820 Transcript_54093/m.125820 type:complete len:379 (+) Transcript_54093:52-1188(+)
MAAAQTAIGFCCTRGFVPFPPSSESQFDKDLLEAFGRALRNGSVKVNPGGSRRRRLDGFLGIVVQNGANIAPFIQASGSLKGSTNVTQDPDPDEFNFTKVDESGKVLVTKVLHPGSGAETPISVIAHPAPLARAHLLFVPQCERLLPHVLTEETLLHGLGLLSKSSRHDFRLLFDSLAASSLVNHFHYHGIYLDYASLQGGKLPLEKVERTLISGDITEGRVAIELLLESQWYVRGFVVSAGHKAGGSSADLEALARTAASLIGEFHRMELPHNVIMAQPSTRKTAKIIASTADPSAYIPTIVTPEVYIIPRRPSTEMPASAGMGATAFELSGFILALSDEAYAEISEASLREVFGSNVSCKGASFDELICKAAWLSN